MIFTLQRAHCAPGAFITAAVPTGGAGGKAAAAAARQGSDEGRWANRPWHTRRSVLVLSSRSSLRKSKILLTVLVLRFIGLTICRSSRMLSSINSLKESYQGLKWICSLVGVRNVLTRLARREHLDSFQTGAVCLGTVVMIEKYACNCW